MGFFGKDRHGVMHTVKPGRQFIWEIPLIDMYRDTVLDGENVKSHKKVEFHFHMTVSEDGNIGFYLHYKGPPIPKYSYYLAAKAPEKKPPATPPAVGASSSSIPQWKPPPMVDGTRVSRVFTAHTIARDLDKCGHWAVSNQTQLKDMLKGTDGTLLVVFEFDDDDVKSSSNDAGHTLKWTIPAFSTRLCTPLSSRGFGIDGMLNVLRMDRKETANGVEYVVFVFNRTNIFPPHSLSLLNTKGEVIGNAPKRDDNSALFLFAKEADVHKSIAPIDDTLVVSIVFHKTKNPLEMLNNLAAQASNGSGTDEVIEQQATAPKTAMVGKSAYVVVSDDL